MTENDVLTYIKASLPPDVSDTNSVAGICLQKAILKIGRMPNVDWNRRQETFSLTSGTSQYRVGVDILKTYDQTWNIQELWSNDTPNWEIKIKTLDDFNDFKRGTDTTGRPVMASYYGDRVLEFYPAPDSAYELWVYVRKDVKKLDEIPDIYHDVVVDYALLCARALRNVEVALRMTKEGLDEMTGDSLVVWRGNVARLDINMGKQAGVRFKDSDSQNLRGD